MLYAGGDLSRKRFAARSVGVWDAGAVAVPDPSCPPPHDAQEPVHQILIAHGIPAREADLFGRGGRDRLERLLSPEPWQTSVRASLLLIDQLDEQVHEQERLLRAEGAAHPYVRS